jgi:hypothetical protein
MQGQASITGLKSAMKSMAAAFPANPDKQRGILNATMRGAAVKTILQAAKANARAGDSSGALAESIGIRTSPKGGTLRRGKVAGIYLTPLRNNPRAIALYIAHYRSKRAFKGIGGIRHGHLVEFGHATKNGGFVPARPFLWPAAASQSPSYRGLFAALLSKKIEAAVKRAARKGKGK